MEQILSAYHERSGLRGVERSFDVSRLKLVSWLKKNETNPKLVEVTAIFGKLINLSFLSRHMNVLAKEADRPIIWNVSNVP